MGAAVSGAHPPNGITVGSRIILSTLWTPEELMGKPEDKFAVRQPAPSNRNPPQRLSPVNTHIPLFYPPLFSFSPHGREFWISAVVRVAGAYSP
jgi:hypothetical protein